MKRLRKKEIKKDREKGIKIWKVCLCVCERERYRGDQRNQERDCVREREKKRKFT